MPRTRITYPQRRDPAEEARKQAASQFQQQRQSQASEYAAARFNEWAAGAQDREALMNARLQNQQSRAEMDGAKFRHDTYMEGEMNKQVTAYYNAMPVLQENLKQAGIYPGSQRYAQEMAAFAAEIPDARVHHQQIREELDKLSKVDADQAQLEQRMSEQGLTRQAAQIQILNENLASQGQRATSLSTTASGGVDVKSTRSTEGDPNEDLKALKLTPTEFLNHVNAKQGKFDESGKFTQSLNPGEQANAIQFQAGTSKNKDTAGQIVTHNIPLSQFNQIRKGQGLGAIPAYSAPAQQGTSQATPASTMNLSGLAQRALNDPNATEEHKARARQILGIQEENAQ